MKNKILLLSNMYSEKDDYFGLFVKKNFEGLEKHFIVNKIFVRNSNNKLMRFIYYIVYLYEVIKENKNKYQFVYIHFPTRSAIPLLFCKTLKSKLILNFHGTDLRFNSKINKVFFWLQKYLFKKAQLVIVPSSYYLRIAAKYFDKKRLFVSPSSGVPNFFYNSKKNETNELRFTYISTLNEDKGIFDACKAFIKTAKFNSNLQFDIYGRIDLKYKDVLEKYTLFEYINYKGILKQSEIPRVLNGTFCFIFPSKSESLGLVGIESLATGTPIIGSDNLAIQTYLKHENNGLIFKQGCVESLVKCIQRIILDKDLYINLKKNARPSVLHFKESSVQLKLTNRINQLLN